MASRILPMQWFRWSDGTPFTQDECARMRAVMRSKSIRQPGENTKQRFFRVRDTIEKHKRNVEMQQKANEARAAANLAEMRKEMVQ